MELDSLSDMVSFGLAPALVIYLAVLHSLGPVGLAIAIAYPLCGAIRLARFNSDSSGIGKVTFLGCPIPIAASYLWSMVLVRDSLSVWVIAAGTLFVAGAMVSTLKVPKFRKGEGPADVDDVRRAGHVRRVPGAADGADLAHLERLERDPHRRQLRAAVAEGPLASGEERATLEGGGLSRRR